jgi:NAD dependent epimerase/dehydratase family enzyme
MPLPGFWMRALFGEVASVLLEGQRALPKRLQSLGYAFKYPELEGALRNLLQD